MISRRTVLILGAGASVHAGYPTGNDMKKIICEKIGATGSELNRIISMCIKENDSIIKFRDALEYSGKQSVDAFLEHRREFDNIGKLSISKVLLDRENVKKLFVPNNNWYLYLFSKMDVGPKSFSKNQLKIITFNYDRSFESFFYLSLKNSYNLSFEEIGKIMSSIEVIHIYGCVAPVPWNGVLHRYGELNKGPRAVKDGARNIKIITETFNIEEDPEFKRAKEILFWADSIIFLGFAYHPENVRRLNIPWEKETIIGTTYGFTDLERKQINNQWCKDKQWLVDPKYDILGLFREVHQLI